MKHHLHLLLITCLTFAAGFHRAGAQDTAITYQGRLVDGAGAASGSYDFRFSAHDAGVGGTTVGSAVTTNGVAVSNGLFTATLDFGAGVFTGPGRWLQIQVRTNGAPSFATLNPRQPLTPSPYALYAPSAGTAATAATATTATTAASANGVAAGSVGTAGLAMGAVDSSRIADETIATTDLSPTVLSNTFWRLGGNAGTSPGTQFIGTTDNQPLELKVADSRALRLEPQSGGTVNVIAGHPSNAVFGAIGAAIVGGGGASAPNAVAGDYGTIGGGAGNLIQSNAIYSTIMGGLNNHVQGLPEADQGASYSVIAGGMGNTVEPYAYWSSILGGRSNTLRYDVDHALIAGGMFNVIGTNADSSMIGGGAENVISNSANYASIPGGRLNVAGRSYAFAAGQRAKANHLGTFVWADATGVDFASTGNNQFLVRANGGLGINTNNPQSALHVAGTVTATNFVGSGAGLTALSGGALTPGSVTAEAIAPGAVSMLGASDGSPTNAVVVDAAGWVGVGTDQPMAPLDVTGNVIVRNADRVLVNAGHLELGQNTTASGYNTAIAMGSGTTASGQDSLATGWGTTASGASATAIGSGSMATGNGAFAGGASSLASGSWSVALGSHTTASAYGAVALGDNTTASGQGAFAAGQGTTASGVFSTALGAGTVASNSASFAAGTYAKALHNGSFVWGDWQLTDFASTGTNQFLVRATGGVGINKNDPTATLDVNGNARFADNDILLRNDSNHGIGWYGLAKPFGTNTPDGPVVYGYSGGALGSLRSGVSTNVALSWDSAGGVAIRGTVTVSNTVTATGFSGSGSGLTALNAGNLSSGIVPSARLTGTYSSALTFNNAANSFTGSGTGLSGVNADLLDGQHGSFYLNAGNLSAGTLSDSRLSGNVSLLNAAQTYGSLRTFGAGLRLNTTDIYFTTDTGDTYQGLGWYGAGKLFAGVNVNGPVLYGWDGGGLGVNRGPGATSLALTWNSAGNVGVGTSSPGYKLDVNGDLHTSGAMWSYGWIWCNFTDGWNRLDKSGSSAVWVSSDERLKQDIAPVPNAVETLQKLRGVTWQWNDVGLKHLTQDIETSWKSNSGTPEDDQKLWDRKRREAMAELSRPQMGFIAQEVEQVYPDWVRTDGQGYKQVNLERLNAVLVNAVKEQQTQITELKQHNHSLEERLAALEKLVLSQPR